MKNCTVPIFLLIYPVFVSPLLCILGTGCLRDADCIGGSEGGVYCKSATGGFSSQCLQKSIYINSSVLQGKCHVSYSSWGCGSIYGGDGLPCCGPGALCSSGLCIYPTNNCTFAQNIFSGLPSKYPSVSPTFRPSSAPTTINPTFRTYSPTIIRIPSIIPTSRPSTRPSNVPISSPT